MPVAASLFFDDPSGALEVAAVTGTNGKTTTAFLLHSILQASGRRDRAPDEHRAPRRRRAAPDRAEHARGDRPPAPAARDGRLRRPRLRARGDLGGPGPGTARRDAVRRARLHEPDAGSPELPRDDGGVLRGQGRPLRPGRPRRRERRRRVGAEACREPPGRDHVRRRLERARRDRPQAQRRVQPRERDRRRPRGRGARR